MGRRATKQTLRLEQTIQNNSKSQINIPLTTILVQRSNERVIRAVDKFCGITLGGKNENKPKAILL